MNNPETYLISDNRFINYLVLIFVDKKKAQIYTFPNRVDEYDTIKLIIDFQYKRLFRPNKHLERYHITKPKDESFLFKMGDKKYFMLENLYSHLQQIATLQNMDSFMVIMISSLLLHMIKQIFIIC